MPRDKVYPKYSQLRIHVCPMGSLKVYLDIHTHIMKKLAFFCFILKERCYEILSWLQFLWLVRFASKLLGWEKARNNLLDFKPRNEKLKWVFFWRQHKTTTKKSCEQIYESMYMTYISSLLFMYAWARQNWNSWVAKALIVA